MKLIIQKLKNEKKNEKDLTISLDFVFKTNPKKKVSNKIKIELPNSFLLKKFNILIISDIQRPEEKNIIQINNPDIISKTTSKELKKFTHCICLEKFSSNIIKFAPILGKLRIMPNKKDGTLTNDIENILADIKKGNKFYTIDQSSTKFLKIPIATVLDEDDLIIKNIEYLVEKMKNLFGKLSDSVKEVYIKTTQGKPIIISNEYF